MIARDPRPETQSAFRAALSLMSGRTLGFAVSFLIPVILARILDQADFGVYKQFFLIAATLYGVGQLGMAESLFYFLPREPAHAGRYIANATLALAAGGLACLAGLVLWGGALFRWVGNPDLERVSAVLGAYLFLTIASAALEIVMVARKRYALASRAYAGLDVLRAALLIGPGLVAGDLSWVLLGALLFAAVRFAITVCYLGAAFKGGLRPDPELFGTQVAYAAPFALAGLIEIVQVNFHQYFVAYHVDAATFAIYAVGCLQVPLVDVVTTSVLNVTMVRMSEETTAGRARAAVAVWHDSIRKLALIFFPVAGLLMVVAHPLIVLLFTERYAASVPVFMASSLALLVPVIGVDAVLRVHAQTRVLFGLNLVRLAATVALVAPLVAAFGLVGAVLATVIAAAVARALGLVRIAQVLHLAPWRLLPWSSLARILTAAVIAGAAAAAVSDEIAAGPLWSLASAGLVYGMTYAAGLWILGGLNEPERTAIKARLARHVLATSGTGR